MASITAPGFVLSLQTALSEPGSKPGNPHGITPPQHRHGCIPVTIETAPASQPCAGGMGKKAKLQIQKQLWH